LAPIWCGCCCRRVTRSVCRQLQHRAGDYLEGFDLEITEGDVLARDELATAVGGMGGVVRLAAHTSVPDSVHDAVGD
jgi:hypothetical protein